MHGAANDFVVIDHRAPFLEEPAGALVRRLCDRRRGVGADGVLLLDRDPELDFAMRYWNADGGAADYCGNGARCLAAYALSLGLGRGGEVTFRTAAGVQTARRIGERLEVRFGRVAAPRRESLETAGRSFSGWFVRAGVPHLVIEVPRLKDVPLLDWAPPLRRHAHFGTEGANVDFVDLRGEGVIGMRTFERGVEGETLACGSGAIASALARAAEGREGPIAVETAGGDVLGVRWEAADGGYDVWLEGPAEVAFRGTWPLEVEEPVTESRRTTAA